MSDDKKDKIKNKIADIIDFDAYRKKHDKEKTKTKKKKQKIDVQGTGNIVAGRDVNITTPKLPTVRRSPTPGTIEHDPDMKRRVRELVNKIRDARMKFYKETSYGKVTNSVYASIRKELGLSGKKIDQLWGKRVELFPNVIYALEKIYGKTVEGKIEKASRKEGYVHTFGHLYKQETELLQKLGLDRNSDDLRNMRKLCTGNRSTKDLDLGQMHDWVAFLRNKLSELIGEEE